MCRVQPALSTRHSLAANETCGCNIASHALSVAVEAQQAALAVQLVAVVDERVAVATAAPYRIVPLPVGEVAGTVVGGVNVDAQCD